MSKSTVLTFIILTAITYSFLFTTSPKDHYHSLFLSSSFSNNSTISLHLRTLTRRPHIAGSLANSEVASYVLSTFTSSSLKSHIATYQTSLTYPIHRSLTLKPTQSSKPIVFKLEQEHIGDNPYLNEVTPTFHGYAKSGNVSGLVVYANYGRVEDFVRLNLKVNVFGCIVIARYGEIYRGDIVRNAYSAGAVGVVIYTDKRDYGRGGGGGEGECFPKGKWMPPNGVQVGSVYNGLGDPTTPGWASVDGCERLSEEVVESSGDYPQIPSLPISGDDGEVILKTIVGGDLDNPIGPGPGILNLSYIVSV